MTAHEIHWTRQLELPSSANAMSRALGVVILTTKGPVPGAYVAEFEAGAGRFGAPLAAAAATTLTRRTHPYPRYGTILTPRPYGYAARCSATRKLKSAVALPSEAAVRASSRASAILRCEWDRGVVAWRTNQRLMLTLSDATGFELCLRGRRPPPARLRRRLHSGYRTAIPTPRRNGFAERSAVRWGLDKAVAAASSFSSPSPASSFSGPSSAPVPALPRLANIHVILAILAPPPSSSTSSFPDDARYLSAGDNAQRGDAEQPQSAERTARSPRAPRPRYTRRARGDACPDAMAAGAATVGGAGADAGASGGGGDEYLEEQVRRRGSKYSRHGAMGSGGSGSLGRRGGSAYKGGGGDASGGGSLVERPIAGYKACVIKLLGVYSRSFSTRSHAHGLDTDIAPNYTAQYTYAVDPVVDNGTGTRTGMDYIWWADEGRAFLVYLSTGLLRSPARLIHTYHPLTRCPVPPFILFLLIAPEMWGGPGASVPDSKLSTL
ncbi:hypothetical protein C8R45DRAFT_1089324 [Mycena sanguinolenta]|nr:hypothetical protein C8R45DRAFT_1089324 [Mycena sanguinolenta]